ncbi:hypothetical protein COV19_01370 [Candidatus Woesearchaeota archaeon CG10_big_fil_rev_8_21_14_0_10_44_13]|nr:MAG: hypothetical protein COV19_01370 [Candidatus Woesearchaeota archaeon CG10_big_fil_rev_8_21_14_0_10_44_13]
MGFWINLLTSRIFISVIVALVLAQAGKVLVLSVKKRRFDASLMARTGGMPSSHTAVVVALTASIYYQEGVSALAIAAGTFAVIVVHDALTLRRAVGFQSEAINKIIKKMRVDYKRKLRELLGHNFTEVLIGGLLGYIVAYAVYSL